MYEGQVKRYRGEIEKQQSSRAAAERKAASAQAAAVKLEQEAGKTKSESMVRSKLQRAASKHKEAGKEREAAAKASKALADAQKKLHEAERKLAAARAKEDDKRRREQERADRRREQEERRRAAEIASLQGDHAALAAHIASEPWADAPAEVTVLFVAADPDRDDGEPPLRLDREVAEIQRRLRMSEYRDSVRFAWRLAARSAELMQHLNEDRPHIVHFSGHSNRHGLVFEDSDGRPRLLSNGQLANLLNVTSDRIRLAMFNSCESSDQAETATAYIDAAIGMEQTIGDTSAKIFAAQFYNSLGFGHSLQKAFDQALVQLEIETGGRSGNPQLYVAPGLDTGEMYLVAPPA
jgi:hypothetical protein